MEGKARSTSRGVKMHLIYIHSSGNPTLRTLYDCFSESTCKKVTFSLYTCELSRVSWTPSYKVETFGSFSKKLLEFSVLQFGCTFMSLLNVFEANVKTPFSFLGHLLTFRNRKLTHRGIAWSKEA